VWRSGNNLLCGIEAGNGKNYRKDAEGAEKGKRFNTEGTEESRRTPRKRDRSFATLRMTMLVASLETQRSQAEPMAKACPVPLRGTGRYKYKGKRAGATKGNGRTARSGSATRVDITLGTGGKVGSG